VGTEEVPPFTAHHVILLFNEQKQTVSGAYSVLYYQYGESRLMLYKKEKNGNPSG